MNIRVLACIQARLTSTRLPAKVLLDFFEGSILEVCVASVACSHHVDEVCVLIPDSNNEPILDVLERVEDRCSIVTGSESDVLSRFLAAAEVKELKNEDYIVRVTSDCPLVSPVEIDFCVEKAIRESFDYLANTCPKPGSVVDGFDVEVIRVGALRDLDTNYCLTDSEREHVTTGFGARDGFSKGMARQQTTQYADLKLSLDTLADYLQIRDFCQYSGGLEFFRTCSYAALEEALKCYRSQK